MAAEVLRATTSPAGPAVFDFADGVLYSYIPDSLAVDAGQAGGPSSPLDERYGGSVADFELRGNGTLHWRAVVQDPGGHAPALVAPLVAEVERADPPGTRFVEWQPAGGTSPLWYERRGPGTAVEVERWADGTITILDIALPIAPVALGAPLVVSPAAQALPAVFALGTVPGSLWAALDVSLDIPAVSPALKWALMAPKYGSYGIVQAENVALSPWTTGGGQATVSVAPNSTYELAFGFGPSTLNFDEFEQDQGVEVWARINYDPASILAPSVVLRRGAYPVGPSGYSIDLGPGGRQLLPATSGARWTIARCGLLRIPNEPTVIAVDFVTGAVASGNLIVDLLLVAPGRWRACSPTGIPNDASYPAFLPGTGALTKRIAHDLSGRVAPAPGQPNAGLFSQDTGLGGSPLYVPPGATSVLIAASQAVPDDPSSAWGGDLAAPAVAPTFTVRPRYRLLDAV